MKLDKSLDQMMTIGNCPLVDNNLFLNKTLDSLFEKFKGILGQKEFQETLDLLEGHWKGSIKNAQDYFWMLDAAVSEMY